jgi:hypothetical protein
MMFGGAHRVMRRDPGRDVTEQDLRVAFAMKAASSEDVTKLGRHLTKLTARFLETHQPGEFFDAVEGIQTRINLNLLRLFQIEISHMLIEGEIREDDSFFAVPTGVARFVASQMSDGLDLEAFDASLHMVVSDDEQLIMTGNKFVSYDVFRPMLGTNIKDRAARYLATALLARGPENLRGIEHRDLQTVMRGIMSAYSKHQAADLRAELERLSALALRQLLSG